ncbi:MAG: T9SS type A sorting domain-containing protein, partial [Bacteroidia bacterium]
DEDVNIIITDIQGKEVARKTISGKNLSEESIDLSAANSGIYLMKVETGAKIYMKKLQVN